MKVLLVILDGWGIAPSGPGNCISLAKTPYMNYLLENFSHTELEASGNAVGLPQKAMGTSEVGHLHIGAGRVVWQPIALIDNQIKTKEFFDNKELKKAILGAKKKCSALHLMGLCSDGLVHSSLEHLFALLEMSKKHGLQKVFIHFFSDGRDVKEKSALEYIKKIEEKTSELGIGEIASVIGRFYSMDRDNNYDRTQKAYTALTEGTGFKAQNPTGAIMKAYERGDQTDYYIQPTIITKNEKPLAAINDSDSVIFFNTRTDRIRQLIKCFTQKKFDKFKRNKKPVVAFVSFVQTDKTIPEKQCRVAFKALEVKNNLGQVIAKTGARQIRVAETEKYAHVTYFFNSQVEKPEKKEDRVMVPSKKVESFDLAPEMSAGQITQEAIKAIKAKKYGFIVVNYANADLVGHSANIPAIIKAVEVIDECLEKTCKTALENKYTVIITADHGNAEEKISKTGEKIPSHSTNKVPFILVSEDKELKNTALKKKGGLIDVAPTIIGLMGLKKPKEMTGTTLIGSGHV